MAASVSKDSRHSKRNRCHVCEGAEQDPRGQARRCTGYDSTDGEICFCSRPEYAGTLRETTSGTYAHRMHGLCGCGTEHGPALDDPNVAATYEYTHPNGVAYLRVLRTHDKRFYQQYSDGLGRWVKGRNGLPRTLFRLHRLLKADPAVTVFVVEGEKDVEAAESLGLLATTNPEGALKWHFLADHARGVLEGRNLVLIPDDDADGKGLRHMKQVAEASTTARSVRIVPLPQKDLADFIGVGGTRADLEEIVASAPFVSAKGEKTFEPRAAWEGFDEAPPANDDEVPASERMRDAVKDARATLKLWTPEAIWAELPAPDYLVDGLFVRGSLGLFVAYGSSLKTWMALALSLAAATGSEWLGRPCKRVQACIVDFESGDYELRRRAHKVARGHGYVTPIDGFTFCSMPGLNLGQSEFFEALEPLTRRFGLIVIDSLAAGSGGVDENDARFAHPLNRLKAMAAESGCVIVLIHHSRKTSGEGKTDEREMVRGSSAIFNAVDIVLGLTRGEDGLFVVRQSKARGGAAVAPFTVRVDDVGPDAVRVSAGTVKEDDAPKKSPSQSLRAAKATLLALFAKEKDIKSKNAAFRRTKGKRGTVFDAIDELEEEGLIVVYEEAFRLRSEVE